MEAVIRRRKRALMKSQNKRRRKEVPKKVKEARIILR